jgi:peptide/nickel transport system substrate-binding protein
MILLAPAARTMAQTPAATPAAPTLDALTIALPSEPVTLDPALTYDADGWSVIHSIYDSLVAYDPGGTLQPLLAESWDDTDPTALTFRLRTGITFHDGQPLTSADVAATFRHLVDQDVASQAAGNFAAVTAVETPDDLTARFVLAEPAPYLLAQIAAYLAILPASAVDSGTDLSTAPVGTGPYRFVAWERGQQVTLEANPNYPGGPKGSPIASTATFRFIGDASTRVAELVSGTARIVRDVPVDQVGEVEDGGAVAQITPVSGLSFVRIATDVAPFDDPRVRQALNHAVDVESITSALLGAEVPRVATLLDPTSLGYDPALPAYTYDPDQARALLAEAGVEDRVAVELEVTSTGNQAVAEAIAAQLGEVGFDVSVVVSELARFNETWAEPAAPALRLLTWTPLFDPYSLLGLVVASEGFLSRYANPEADALIVQAGTEPDATARGELYRQLGAVLNADPPAIFMAPIIARYGVAASLPGWQPRADDYIMPLHG